MSVLSEGNNIYILENQQQGSPQQQRIVQTRPFITAPATTGLANTSHFGTIPQLASPIKRRKNVRNACVNCKKACKKCDDGRPCQRCIKYEITETCKNSVRKERQKGIKRGPYKRRTQNKIQDDKVSTTSLISVSSAPIFPDGKISEQLVNSVPINIPVIPPQILGIQVPTTTTTSDGVGQFIIIPQSSGGTSYYITMPIQQQNRSSISAVSGTTSASTCASKTSTKVRFEFLPEEFGELLLEDSQKPESAATEGISRETNPNKEKEKEKSNLSILSLICSDLLNEKQVATPESDEKNSTLDSVKNQENLPKAWTSTNTGDNRVTAENTKYEYVKPQVDNENHTPLFETPSAGSPLLSSIPSNTYPDASAQYVQTKHKSSNDNMRHTKNEEFQLSQNSVSFSQDRMPMQQPYYGISSFTPPHSVTSSFNYMAQNQLPSLYTNQRSPQQITPAYLSFAFTPGSNTTSQSPTHASISASSNGSDQKRYSY